MPVDLSMIGLKGIAAGQDTLNSIAQREALQSQTAIQQGVFDREQADLELQRSAVDKIKNLMRGEHVDMDSGNVSETDMSKFMMRTGAELAAAGAPDRGSKLMEAGLDLRKKQGEIDKQAFDQDKVKLDNIITAANYVANGVADVRNDSELQFFWDTLDPAVAENIGAEKLEVLKSVPYSPDWIAAMKDQSMTAKEQAQLDMLQQGQARSDRSEENTRIFREATLNIAKQRADAADRAQKAAEKAGGNNISKAANSEERAAVRSALAGAYPDLGFAIESKEDSLDLIAATNDIVGEAKQILADTQGITFNEAIQRAMLRAKAAGELGHITVDKNLFKANETTRTYKARGRSPDNALSMPIGDTTEQVQPKLIKGRYYNTPAGTLKWNGSTFD